MTTKAFYEFIDKYNLHFSDGLIKVTFSDNSSYEAIWITTIPDLRKSMDGKFDGLPEHELFYLIKEQKYYFRPVEDILELHCVQQNYLT